MQTHKTLCAFIEVLSVNASRLKFKRLPAQRQNVLKSGFAEIPSLPHDQDLRKNRSFLESRGDFSTDRNGIAISSRHSANSIDATIPQESIYQ
jgi:hypothetical protein